MSDLLSRIKLGTANQKLVKWPGNDQTVLMRILSQHENLEAVLATERLFKGEKVEIQMQTAEEYENEKATQLLFRALRDPEKPGEPVCGNVTEFRRSLTKGEKKILIDEYLAFETDCDPRPDNMSNDEFDALLSELKKTPDVTLGSISSISVLKKLTQSLVSQLLTSRTDSGSTSSRSTN